MELMQFLLSFLEVEADVPSEIEMSTAAAELGCKSVFQFMCRLIPDTYLQDLYIY